ncbi:ankyrin repeat-containing domain protein [Podospora fimiseda]|uniref:Ankyrin repeat-containing domain protein n=1 Tax=Podospora fimiseda TaxID=252190 RepID=A0AAN7GU50_9PEZI|nr:ankyrin repeat-containing domain protein [Podospora fimiseda]
MEVEMESSKERYIQRRRLQNRMAQRRFRQRHSQAKQQQQQQEQEESDQQQRQRTESVHTISGPQSCEPEPLLDHDMPTNSNSPSPTDFFGAALDMDALEAAFSHNGPSPVPEAKQNGWCSLGYGGSMLLETIASMDMESRFAEPSDAASINMDSPAFGTSARPSTSAATIQEPLTTAETAVEQLFSEFHNLRKSFPSPPYSQHSSGASVSHGTDRSPPSQHSASSNKWQSSLHIAAQKGHNRIVCVLLQHNSDCNEKDSEGLTPLIHATIGGYDDVVSSLLTHGARITSVDNQHRSALHWAVLHRREAMLKLLLKHCPVEDRDVVDGYDVNGKTPLHTAIDSGFETGVQMLLQFGANVHYRAGVP